MKRANQFFTEEQRKAISGTVAEAERRTSGEIVPVVATASGRYDRAEDAVGFLIALITVTLAWIFFQEIRPVQADWASGQTLTLGLVPVLLLLFGGFIVGTIAAAYFPGLRLAFVPRREMSAEVERSAAEAFHQLRVRRTVGGTGILIYISLYERMVRILGDEPISEKVNQADWNAVRDLVIEGLRANRPADGLVAAIEKCGELLSRHFPVQPGDVNELGNELRFLD